MKKKWMKVITTLLLCLTLVVSSAYIAYKTPQEVEAIAIVDDVAILLMFLASAGITYTGYVDVDQNVDNWAQDLQGVADDVAGLMDGISFDLAYEESGMTNPETDPDQDPNNKPSKWEQFKNLVKKNLDKHGGLYLKGAIATIFLQANEKLVDMLPKGDYMDFATQELAKQENITDLIPYDEFLRRLEDKPYYFMLVGTAKGGTEKTVTIMMQKDPFALMRADKGPYYGAYTQSRGSNRYTYSDGAWKTTNTPLMTYYEINPNYAYSISSNVPVFPWGDSGFTDYYNAHCIEQEPYVAKPASKLNNSNIALTSKAQESPEVQELPKQVYMPSKSQLQDYINQLQNAQSTAERQSAVDNFVNTITTPVTDPGTDPGNPDNPDITPTPPPEQPDNPDNESFTADLKTLFPFCIPFDLMHTFELLDAEPQVPTFTLPFHVEFRGKVLADEKWIIDFQDYDSVVKIFRILETLGFCVALILSTRTLIKG
ncbi:med21 domain-containing protein [Ruminococcus sp. OA3]|uniref:med21 domain-containing protein n=1 Tax=Ruminococcus sp. OA3 TaxID=2914164 RepID=UPI001F06E273|nr:med21 domain-containing protein [Ruminococcus sp. OA3]MCH1981788.1 med21 domain-containing protein [Ruminococcus sp. OA3]